MEDDKITAFTEKVEAFMKKHRWKIFAFTILLTSIFSLLLFDIKISTGGDDSAYILAAKNFLSGSSFPDWHGAFYPIFLSFFMKIFGLNLVLFKILSFLMIIAHLVLFYLIFRKRVSWTVLLFSMFFFSICLELIYFGGQTYSEALYILLQICVFAAFYRIYDTHINKTFNFFGSFVQWLIFGFTIFLLTITRNIGWVMLFSAVFYFLVIKQYKRAIKTFLYFFMFYLPYFIYKIVFWGTNSIGFEAQVSKMFWINPYDRNEGLETIGGFFHRLFVNSEQYLSNHLFEIFSWNFIPPKSAIVTIAVYVLFAFVGFVIIKKNKQLLFPFIYLIFALLATFISQQIMWNQIRLVLIFIPIIVLLTTDSLSQIVKDSKHKVFKFLPIIFLFALIIPSTIKTVKISKAHYPILQANFKGDKYYGFTPDWQNYLKMSEWVSKNIPNKFNVACRKPGMSFIYGNGRNFSGIYSVQTFQIDDVFSRIKKDKKTYYFFVDYRAEGEKFFALYPYFYYISVILNNSDGKQFITFSVDEKSVNSFFSTATNADLNLYNLEEMKTIFAKKRDNDYAVYPDSLLSYLKKNKIDYMIAGHLRKDPNKKTDNFITTMYRYIYFIEMKYPGIFDIIWQIGNENEENAILVKIDYQKAVLKKLNQ